MDSANNVACGNDKWLTKGARLACSFYLFTFKQCHISFSRVSSRHCTSQEPVLKAAGKGSSYLDMCFGFVEQPKRGVPGAVWSERYQNF